MAAIAHSIDDGSYWVPVDEIAAAIMRGPFGAYLNRIGLFDVPGSDPAESDNDD